MVKLLNGYKTTKIFLFLTILLAPLYVVRFRIGSYPSTPLEVLVGLTLVSWMVERKGIKGVKGINVPVALFLAAAAVSVIVSPDKRGALGIFKAYFVEPILVYLVIKDVVKSRKDWWLVLGFLGLSGLWVALLAVFQTITGQLTFAPHEAALGRAHAVYNTANAVGLYLGPIIFLLLGTVGGLKGVKGVKEIMVGGIGLLVAAVVLSKSAGAVVGLVVASLVPIAYFLSEAKNARFSSEARGSYCLLPRKWVVRGVGVVGVVGLIVGGWLFFNISNFTPKNVDPYLRKSTDTLQFRLCLWEGTRNLLLERPVFGAGLSGFKELYSARYFTCDAEPLEYPHNWILNMWVELGVLGLAAFVWLLWGYCKSVNVSMCQCVKGAFLAAMVYWLVHGLVDVPYFKNDLSLEFWVLVGLAETLSFAF